LLPVLPAADQKRVIFQVESLDPEQVLLMLQMLVVH
jgi:hypothetical protein